MVDDSILFWTIGYFIKAFLEILFGASPINKHYISMKYTI
jgi:hypothetical protein